MTHHTDRPPLKTMMRMLAKLKEDYGGLEFPWTALLDAVRFSFVSKTLEGHISFAKRFLPTGVPFDAVHGGGGSSGGGGGGDGEAAAEKDSDFTAVRAKSTMDVPDATVKQELWNLVYHPAGLTFETMVGTGGLEEVVDAYRWEEYGDVEWAGEWVEDGSDDEGEDDSAKVDGGDDDDSDMPASNLPDKEPRNFVTVLKPRNPMLATALEMAKEDNPHVSGYLWEPALKLIAHPQFAAESVAMVIEVQFYLEAFLQSRKAVHCHYKITRAPTLASLAQDCRKYAKNPALSYSRQLDRGLRVGKVETAFCGLYGELQALESRAAAVQKRVVALTH